MTGSLAIQYGILITSNFYVRFLFSEGFLAGPDIVTSAACPLHSAKIVYFSQGANCLHCIVNSHSTPH